MTREMIFNVWAPREGRWSPWVKPVLFSFMIDSSLGCIAGGITAGVGIELAAAG